MSACGTPYSRDSRFPDSRNTSLTRAPPCGWRGPVSPEIRTSGPGLPRRGRLADIAHLRAHLRGGGQRLADGPGRVLAAHVDVVRILRPVGHRPHAQPHEVTALADLPADVAPEHLVDTHAGACLPRPADRAWVYIQCMMATTSSAPASGHHVPSSSVPSRPNPTAAASAIFTYFHSVSARSSANSSVVCGELFIALNRLKARSA